MIAVRDFVRKTFTISVTFSHLPILQLPARLSFSDRV